MHCRRIRWRDALIRALEEFRARYVARGTDAAAADPGKDGPTGPTRSARAVRAPAEDRTPRGGRIEQARDCPRQQRLVQVAHDPRALHEAHLAVLLRDEHDDCIGLLGDAQRGTMARP